MSRPPRTSADRSANHIRDSERRFRRLALLAPVGIFETDADGNCLFANERWYELAGMSPEQARGRGWLEAVHPDDRERIFREWYGVAREGRDLISECRFVVPGGVRWLQGTARAVRDASGRITSYIGAVTPIDARKAVESELRASETRLDAVLASIGDYLVTYDRAWRFTYVNDAAARLLRRPVEELLGRSVWHVFPEAVGGRHHQELHQAVEEQRVIRSEQFFPGFGLWLENHIYPSATGVTVFASDITWRKQLENELVERNERLAEADRMKDEFLALLAHELRNPLAPVRSALEVMRMPSAAASSVARMRDVAERQLEHMARLLDDLLDVSRIGRGGIDFQADTVDVGAIIRRTVEALRPALESKQQSLAIRMPADTLLLEADALRMEQVLMNLLSNAVKYTPEGGGISISAQPHGGEIELRVRDSGIGIASATLPRVFDLFVRAEARGEEGPHRGMGVGLALVKKLVELHGGRVEVHSGGLGKGSEFVVKLPAPTERGRFADLPRQVEAPPAGRALRVLVVDDNRDAADSLALLLEIAGHEARAAYTGREALSLARELRPDVILLDLGMPGMDGYEVASRLRRDPATRGVTLIALTGWGQEADRKRSAEAGFDRHLTKPVAFEVVQRLFAEIGAPPERGPTSSSRS